MNILALCTENSVRSILLEAILCDLGGARAQCFSAGSRPLAQVHPSTLKILDEYGHDTRDTRSKSWDEFKGPHAPEMDIVITVCGDVADKGCPIFPGSPIRAHWSIDDPAAAEQSQQEAAFRATYDLLHRRANALLRMPIETMDSGEIKALLDRIARLR